MQNLAYNRSERASALAHIAHPESVVMLADLAAHSRVGLTGVQGFIDGVVVYGAVERVGTTLGDNIHDRSAGGAELRGEIAGLDGDFLNRVHRWLRFHGGPEKPRAGRVHGRAIQASLK